MQKSGKYVILYYTFFGKGGSGLENKDIDQELKELQEKQPAKPALKDKLGGAAAFTADYLSKFGRYICSVIVLLIIHLGRNILRFLKYVWGETVLLRKAAFSKLKYLGVLIVSPFLSVRNGFARARKKYRKEKRQRGVGAGVSAALKELGNFVFGKSGIAVSLFNLAAPVICAVFLFNIVAYASSLNYAVKLVVNGRFLGYIENEQVYYDAEAILKERINYLGSEASILVEPSYSIELIENKDTLTKFQVADKMLEYSDLSVEYAYGFYLNGVFYGAIFDNTEVKQTLDNIISRYKVNYPGADVSFEDKIECDTAGLYLSGSIIDTDWLISQLTSIRRQAGYYIVEEEDTLQSICDKLGMSEMQLSFLNTGLDESRLFAGSRLKIREEVPFLSVGITVIEDYDTYVPYQTEYYYDDSLYEGVSRPTTEGVDGVNHVTANVTYVNSLEVKRDIINTRVISQPVTMRIAQGTKPTPESVYSPEDAEYGKYIWPVRGGSISEYTVWDGGYGGHMGLDIVSTYGYGTEIFAGATGTVTVAGYNGGFGNYVVIDHGNGYSTLYAHCSALFVTVGQKVTQGECIAALGSSGYSTGPHVHFEVLHNGVNVNPKGYLNMDYQ